MKTGTSKNAAKAGVGYTVGNILIRGLSFLTLPIFTRLMSTSEYGIYTTYVSYESIVTLVFGLGLYSSLKAAKIEFDNKLDSYVSTVSILPIGILIVSILGMLPFSTFFGTLLGMDRYMLFAMLIQAWASSVITMYNCRISLDYAYKKYIILALVNSLSNVVLSLLLILTICRDNPSFGRILGTCLPVIAIGIILTIGFFRKERPRNNKEFVRFGLSYSLPLIPHGLSQLILSQFGKIIIQKKIGNDAAGIYGFAYTIALIPQILASSFDTVWGTWFFENYKKGKEEIIKQRANQYTALFSAVTVGIMCVSPEIVKVMADSSYWPSMEIVCPAILGVFFSFLYSLPAQVEYYYKKTKYIALGTMIAAIFNVILCIYFVPVLGYEAAVYVTVLTYVLYFVAHMIIAYIITEKQLPFDLKGILVYVCSVCVVCMLVQCVIDIWWLRYTILICYMAVLGIIHRIVIKELIGGFICEK